jgi:hypothetical protein
LNGRVGTGRGNHQIPSGGSRRGFPLLGFHDREVDGHETEGMALALDRRAMRTLPVSIGIFGVMGVVVTGGGLSGLGRLAVVGAGPGEQPQDQTGREATGRDPPS